MAATVLLVDFDASRRTANRATLTTTPEDLVVKEAADLGAARLLIQSGTVDVVVCVHETPHLDALQLLREARGSYSAVRLPVLIAAAAYHLDMRQSAFSMGANDCFMLPCPPAEFGTRVQTQLRYKQAVVDMQVLGDQQRHLATHDPLTGLANRDHLLVECRRELARSQRHGFAFALCALDIDHFRQLNTQLGHIEGDNLIMEVGQMVEQALRAQDTLARSMGARFLALLPQTDAQAALRVCDRLRNNVRGYPFGALPVGAVTLSLGLVAYPKSPLEGVDALHNAAETSLNQAKEKGGDVVQPWGELASGD